MKIRTVQSIVTSIVVVVLIGACRKDPPIELTTPPVPSGNGTLRVHFVPEWVGQPVAFYTEYLNFSNYRTTLEELKMFLSEVDLVSDNGATRLEEVHYLKFEGGQPLTVDWSAAPGTYSLLRTGIGVPAVYNAMDPLDPAAPEGLRTDLAAYWNWNSGYRFVQFVGRFDTIATNTGAMGLSYNIHTGLDTCYTKVDHIPSEPITISAGTTTDLTIKIAVDKFYYSATDTINLAVENNAHGANIPLALKLTRNVAQSFSLE